MLLCALVGDKLILNPPKLYLRELRDDFVRGCDSGGLKAYFKA